jgi:hypothetical protein
MNSLRHVPGQLRLSQCLPGLPDRAQCRLDGRAAGAVLDLPLAGVALDQVDPRPERVSVSLKPLCSLPSSCWSTVIVPSFSSVTFVSVPFSS